MPISPVRTGETRRVLDQHVQPEDRQKKPQCRAREGKDKVFGQQLAAKPAPAGPQSGAHGKLPLALHQPGQRQVGHVGTGKQQHQCHGAHQHQEGGPRVAGQLVLPAGCGDLQALALRVGVWKLLRHAQVNGVQLGLGSLRASVGRKSGEDVGHAVVALVLHGGAQVVVVCRVVDKELLPSGAGVVRAGLQNAHNPRRLGGREGEESQRASDNRFVCAEDPRPVVVGQHHSGFGPVFVVLGTERATRAGTQSEDFEIVGCD